MTREEFINNYAVVLNRAMLCSDKARREGLLALQSDIDNKKVNERDIFEYGLRFVLDGLDWSFIDNVLSNIIEQEKDEYTLLLKNMQKQAVHSIWEGDNTRMLALILNSLTDLSLNDDEFLKYWNSL